MLKTVKSGAEQAVIELELLQRSESVGSIAREDLSSVAKSFCLEYFSSRGGEKDFLLSHFLNLFQHLRENMRCLFLTIPFWEGTALLFA
jgi:hypothetical protein